MQISCCLGPEMEIWGGTDNEHAGLLGMMGMFSTWIVERVLQACTFSRIHYGM